MKRRLLPSVGGQRYLAVSQHGDDGDSQRFDVLLESGSHGCSQLLQDGQGLLHLHAAHEHSCERRGEQQQSSFQRLQQLTRILLESPSRAFRATGSSPMLGVMNLASEMTAATSSRPSFLIFQFLSSILDTSSDVIFSLQQKEEERSEHGRD